MCSDSQANSFQLTRHASEGGGNLICRGGILPGHPTRHTVPPTCSGRQVKPSFGWVHAMVAAHGRGKPSKKCHVAMALPARQCQLGTVWTFPHEVPAPASQPAGTRGASKARCSPTPKCQQEASSQRAKAWTPCQLSAGCRRRTPKSAQSPISRKLTCLNKINK